MTEKLDPRDAFCDTLIAAAEEDPRIVVVVNDSVGSSKLNAFVKAFPERTVNVGIAEQNMVGVAAGLANAGKLPFVSGAGSFLAARGMEQIKVDAGYAQNNIKLCAQSPGMAYGNLGSTHHSVEDVAWMRAIPGLAVIVPGDHRETAEVMRWAVAHEGPAYIRIVKVAVPNVTPEGYSFEFGKAVTLRDGSDLTIISNGVVTKRALDAAELLAADGVTARVLHMPTVKPLDVEAIVAAARETGAIVTAEEATAGGALGGAVAEVVADHHPVPVKRLGVPDEWAPTGGESFLLDHFGMAPEAIAAACGEVLARKV